MINEPRNDLNVSSSTVLAYTKQYPENKDTNRSR
jgi:hypothetical protein